MSEVQAILLGLVIGALGTLPPAFLFERALLGRQPGVRLGSASIVASFAMLSVALLAIRVVSPQSVLPFGASEAVSFLLVWAVEAWRAWHAE